MHKGAITFTGKSGARYLFQIWSSDTRFRAIGAIYFITSRGSEAARGLRPRHNAIFIGQTENLALAFPDGTLPGHFLRFGANCICVHLQADLQQRLFVEHDLLRAYGTHCNT